jgi:glyoxylase-like metal-dependent hydrolase (beta-lactamase superfamily II)
MIGTYRVRPPSSNQIVNAIPPPELVMSGVWSIPLPLVASPIASVTMYALEHADGLVLIDAGYDHVSCWTVLEQAFAQLGASAQDVTGIVLTHNHPDHVGLAERLRNESGAWVAIHRLDALGTEESVYGPFLDQLATELVLAGAPSDVAREMVEASRRLATHAHGLRTDRFLADGDMIVEGGLALEVVGSPGHTRGHVCLLDRGRRLLFGGDLVLDGGELQLGVVSTPADDPVRELEESLARVATLPVDLVLPGHWDRLTDLPTRVELLLADLRERIADAGAIVHAQPGCTAWELAAAASWGRPWSAMGVTGRRFAVMQALGWARRLVSLGEAALEAGPPERFTQAVR